MGEMNIFDKNKQSIEFKQSSYWFKNLEHLLTYIYFIRTKIQMKPNINIARSTETVYMLSQINFSVTNCTKVKLYSNNAFHLIGEEHLKIP